MSKREEREEKAEKLIRFVEAIQRKERADPEAMAAGVFACLEKIEELRAKPGPKPRQQFFIDTPQFEVALKHVVGELKNKEAVAQLAELSSCGKRTAEGDLAEMKPRAEKMKDLYAAFTEINRKS